jgi:SAM-dependent methyltransferase
VSKPVDFDEYTDDYNRLLQESTRFFSSDESFFARYKVEIVRRQCERAVGRLLEYGCGIGRNIPFLQQAFPGAEIVGSDISAASIEVARGAAPGVRFFVEGTGDPALSGPFDLVFVAGVFHHVPPAQRAQVAATLLERLAPGGRVFVFEHNPFNPVTRRIVSECPYDADAVLLQPGELAGILRAAGFAVERRGFCLFVPPKWRRLAPIERVLGWLPLGGQYWVRALRTA